MRFSVEHLMVTEGSSTRPPKAIALRVARAVGLLVIGLLMLGMSGWGVLALYAVGDERDIVRLRTNYRHDPPEQVYAPTEYAPRLTDQMPLQSRENFKPNAQ